MKMVLLLEGKAQFSDGIGLNFDLFFSRDVFYYPRENLMLS